MRNPPTAVGGPLLRIEDKMNRRGAFTRVELVVMVGIVAFLAAAAVTVGIHLRRTNGETRQTANFQAISAALEAYHADFGDYPRNSSLPTWNTREGSNGGIIRAPVFYSLAAALVGPGPAVTQTVHGELQAGDGNDGPGFRSQSKIICSGMATAVAGNANVKITVDPGEVSEVQAFARDFTAQTPASIVLFATADEPFQESIGISRISQSQNQIQIMLMVPASYPHDGKCEICVADGKVWGPYLAPGAYKVAYIPSVDSYGTPIFGYGQPALLDDWGQVIQYFPRYGPANDRTGDSTYPADSSVIAGPLYGRSQPKSVDPRNGQNALFDWRDGEPFFTLAGQTGPAQYWPDPDLSRPGSFRPDWTIEWLLGAEPDSSGHFSNEIGAGGKLTYDGPYILFSAGPAGPERPNGGYCNFADPSNGFKILPIKELNDEFIKSGNLINLVR